MKISVSLCYVIGLILSCAAFGSYAQAITTLENPALKAPNIVQISPLLVSSGQPTAQSLARLRQLGFGAVIYLAPPTVPDAVPEESALVQDQGLDFVNIPIPFGKPTAADFVEFKAALQRFSGRKVLVHCQVNMRGSSMVFLHRVLVGQEAPDVAYEAVAQVWSPDGIWREFIVSMLRENKIDFEPY